MANGNPIPDSTENAELSYLSNETDPSYQVVRGVKASFYKKTTTYTIKISPTVHIGTHLLHTSFGILLLFMQNDSNNDLEGNKRIKQPTI